MGFRNGTPSIFFLAYTEFKYLNSYGKYFPNTVFYAFDPNVLHIDVRANDRLIKVGL